MARTSPTRRGRTPSRLQVQVVRLVRGESGLLVVPAIGAVVAFGLAVLLLRVETSGWGEGLAGFLFPGSPQSARSILGTIAGSTITLAGLVFSITMLVLQLSSSQYSPRALRTFLQDRNSHVTLATFVATFVFSVVVLRAVGSDEQGTPGLATTIALLLMLATVGVFVQYVNHITKKIRVSSILAAVVEETEDALGRLEADGGRGDAPTGLGSARVVTARGHGYLTAPDLNRLVETAAEYDGYVEVMPAVNDFVLGSSPLLRVWGIDEGEDDDLLAAVELAQERSTEGDPAFGFRQLADIAERALSPSLNDPTTARQCVELLHELLRQRLELDVPTGVFLDSHDQPRASVPVRPWSEYLDLVAELARHARSERSVEAALDEVLADLATRASGPELRSTEAVRSLVRS